MTTEQKAKAYDEALERARKQVSDYQKEFDNHIDKSKLLPQIMQAGITALTETFPQLAESDDERVRKELLSFIESVQHSYLCGTDRREKWIAYLEKQKDLDKMIIVSPEVWDNAISDDFENGKKEGEKQKEQNLNPSNSVGLKEQKEIPLMNGDADLYFDTWIQHNDTTKRGCFEEGIRYAQKLQKEQKSEENHTLEFEKAKAKYEGIVEGKQTILDNPEDYGLCKHTEWSDTKELVFKDICKHLKEEGYNGWVTLLEALHSGEFKQAVTEWSEKDEKKLARAKLYEQLKKLM